MLNEILTDLVDMYATSQWKNFSREIGHHEAREELLGLGVIRFFEEGTTTHSYVYADKDLEMYHTNPLILSAYGYAPDIYFNGVLQVTITASDETPLFSGEIQ